MRVGGAVLAGVMAVVGCASPNWVGYTSVNPTPRPFVRRSAESVEVFVGRPPVRPHVDVGMFEVAQGSEADGTRLSTDDMIVSLRQHAALRGCDAVSVMDVQYIDRQERHLLRGVCAMYTDQQAAQTKPPPGPPLPGEGALCGLDPHASAGPMGTKAEVVSCDYPLQCEDQHCASPYH
jgi:hypothetical protein